MKTTTITPAKFFLALIFAAGCSGLGCDDGAAIVNDSPPIIYRGFSPDPGEAWGPCKESCDGLCFADQDGHSFCAPACTADGCPRQPENMCGDPIAGQAVCLDTGACVAPCDSDADCSAGLVCSTMLGFCAWP